MATGDIDWPSIAPRVAEVLLGPPTSKTRKEWRWGRKGSFALNLENGTWHDYEAGAGGALLDLVIREKEVDDRKQALEWLQRVSQGKDPAAAGPFDPLPAPELRTMASELQAEGVPPWEAWRHASTIVAPVESTG